MNLIIKIRDADNNLLNIVGGIIERELVATGLVCDNGLRSANTTNDSCCVELIYDVKGSLHNIPERSIL